MGFGQFGIFLHFTTVFYTFLHFLYFLYIDLLLIKERGVSEYSFAI